MYCLSDHEVRVYFLNWSWEIATSSFHQTLTEARNGETDLLGEMHRLRQHSLATYNVHITVTNCWGGRYRVYLKCGLTEGDVEYAELQGASSLF